MKLSSFPSSSHFSFPSPRTSSTPNLSKNGTFIHSRQDPGTHPWPLLPLPHHHAIPNPHAYCFFYTFFNKFRFLYPQCYYLSLSGHHHLWLDYSESLIHSCPLLFHSASSGGLKQINPAVLLPCLNSFNSLFSLSPLSLAVTEGAGCTPISGIRV